MTVAKRPRHNSLERPAVRMWRIALATRTPTSQLQVYNIAPSFIMPCMIGYIADVEKPLFLREKFRGAVLGHHLRTWP